MHILLADDESIYCSYLAERLQRHGHSTETALDGHQAIDLISRRKFDCIVVDQRMPGLLGVQVVSALRARGDDTPAIVMSANDVPVREQHLGGVTGFISKPFSSDALVAVIEDVVRNRVRPDERHDHAEATAVTADKKNAPRFWRFLDFRPFRRLEG